MTGVTRGRDLNRRESGLAVVEWILLVGVIIVPMALLLFQIARMIASFYSLTSWIIGLPFP